MSTVSKYWSNRKANKFRRLTAEAIRSRRGIAYVVQSLSLELKKDFVKACNKEPQAGYYKAAILNRVCPICRAYFIHRGSSCVKCTHTEAGRKLSAQRSKETLVKKHGSAEAAKAFMIKQREATSMRRYGVRCPFQAKEVKKKITKALKERYGVDNPSKSSSIQEKKKVTSFRNHGTEYPMQSAHLQEKKKATFIERYGVDNPSKVARFQRKKQETSLQKHGTLHHLQDPKILLKSMVSAHSIWNVKSNKRTYQVQGYERFVISYLEKTYRTVYAQFDSKYKPIELNDRRFIYRPDFFIPRNKTYIEVKSTWTLLQNHKARAESQQKAQMASQAGYTVTVLLVYSKNKMVVLPNTWFKLSTKRLEKLIHSLPVINPEVNPVTIWKEENEVTNENLRNISKGRISSVR